MKLDSAVILAAGVGTRMQRSDDSTTLTRLQATVADSGVKTLIPFGRPFLDYTLGALADVGFKRVCLVVSPHQDELATYCRRLETRRLRLELAVQAEPRGTADAVLASEPVVGTEAQFAVLNGDNYYSPEALRSLQSLDEPGLVAFDRAGLLARRQSNLDRERMARFAVVQADSDGRLIRLLEKPDMAIYDALPEPVLVSMNCWRFSPTIFRACERVSESQRGELELTSAVQVAIDSLGEAFKVLASSAQVLDLSERGDVATVWRYLRGTEVDL